MIAAVTLILRFTAGIPATILPHPNPVNTGTGLEGVPPNQSVPAVLPTGNPAFTGLLIAGGLLTTLPLVLAFLAFQKQFIPGITAGVVK